MLPRVLLAEENLPYRRVIREALLAFRHCEVDDSPNAEHAFELAVQKRYALYVFAISLPDMKGDMLDRLLSKVVPLVHHGSHAAPPVIFLLRPEEASEWQHLSRNARVRGLVSIPPRLDQLMSATGTLLPERSGMPPL